MISFRRLMTATPFILISLFSQNGFSQTQSAGLAPAAAPSAVVDSAEAPVVKRDAPPQNKFEQHFASTATLFISSNYIFRGITQTYNRPAIQGSYDLTHASGLGLGGFVSNVELDVLPKEPNKPIEQSKTEADLYVLYNRTLGAWSLGAMAIWYTYPDAVNFNAMEYSIFAKYRIFKLDLAYMPKYYGSESDQLYARLSGTVPFSTRDALSVSVARTMFNKITEALMKDYMDYKVSVIHSIADLAVEFAYTDTDRKDLQEVKFEDRAFSVIASRTF